MTKCLLCHESIDSRFGWKEFLGMVQEKVICNRCEVQFQLIKGEVCQRCGREWMEVAAEHRYEKVCRDCWKWEEDTEYKGVLTCNRSVYHYNPFMKEVLALYKFRGDAVLAEIFQAELRKTYRTHFQDLLVVPIPLSEKRLYERGFNQSVLLAQQLNKNVSIVEALTKSESGKQSKKGRYDRVDGENTFYVARPEDIKDRKIVLFDDIYTTGTTIRMAAKRLKAAGAKEISSLTLIRS
ncbi:ComF family protein [Sutcliffiella deserti]|uniref:ComF family protein n=1 Tax=Sutcliffiella deserti TaxID=2875501 RepID=UPI001CBCCBC8|nr:ComF family protein [Sutcliffiella deserti]